MTIPEELKNYFSGKNVLVTGGTGMIGRHVVSMLKSMGSQITVISLDDLGCEESVRFIKGDLTDITFCRDTIKGFDAVFHLAGVKGSMEVSKTMPSSHFVPTLMMTTNVLDACKRNNISKVIFTSSIGAYSQSNVEIFTEVDSYEGEPLDFAGWAKRMGELQIIAYKEQFALKGYTAVRLSAVYGPGDNFDPNNAMMIPSLMHKIHNGELPLQVWGDGKAIRDIAYCEDIALGIIQALYHEPSGYYTNLGSGQGVSVKSVVEALNEIIDFDYEFDTNKPSGAGKKLLDIEKAQLKIGYEPKTTLSEGLKKTWSWFLENKNEYELKQNYFRN